MSGSFLVWHSFTIEAAHQVPEAIGLTRLHGHSYWITVAVDTSPAAPYSINNLIAECKKIHARLDHQLLNDLLEGLPIQENIIGFIQKHWEGPALRRVETKLPSQSAGVIWVA